MNSTVFDEQPQNVAGRARILMIFRFNSDKGQSMSSFRIDPKLLSDTIDVASLEICELRLMNDSRWPWLVLIPRIRNAVEWHELFVDQRQDIDFEISQTAGLLKAFSRCEKINIAGIGNMVRQLHIHVIARKTDDPNWPGPVWGHGEREPYTEHQQEALVDALRTALESGV